MTAPPDTGFAGAMSNARRDGLVVVQPRMGFAEPSAMREGLAAVRDARATTVGTITLDSYTRVGDLRSARIAVRSRTGLNGYPLCTHPDDITRSMLSEVQGPGFPNQVRHGSARPGHIIEAMARIGLDATEGGPVSYCLPYGVWRSWSGSMVIVVVIASRTAAAPRPASAGPVFHARFDAEAFHARQVQQHRVAGRASHKGADRGAVQSDDEVTLPMAGHSTIRCLGGPFADRHLGSDHAVARLPGPGAWLPAGRAQSAGRRSSRFNAPRPGMNSAWYIASCEMRIPSSAGKSMRSRRGSSSRPA